MEVARISSGPLICVIRQVVALVCAVALLPGDTTLFARQASGRPVPSVSKWPTFHRNNSILWSLRLRSTPTHF